MRYVYIALIVGNMINNPPPTTELTAPPANSMGASAGIQT